MKEQRSVIMISLEFSLELFEVIQNVLKDHLG